MSSRRAGAPRGVFLGLATLDVVHFVDALPGTNVKITALGQQVAAGGPATSAAITFAAMGGDAVLVTALGVGPVARIVRADIELCGVRVVDVTADHAGDAPVSSITVLAATGERTVVSVDGTATQIESVPDLSTLLDDADVALVDGHHPVLAEAGARAARAGSVPLVLDAGRWREVMRTLLPLADDVICSADFRCPGSTNVESSAGAIAGYGIRTTVVTRGPDPVLWWQGAQAGSVTPPVVLVVDMSGAGDAFHGAYCYLLANSNLDVDDRIEMAARIASIKCCYAGTRTWLAHLAAGSWSDAGHRPV